MEPHVEDRLADLALGLLSDLERAEVVRHAEACPRCLAALGRVQETCGALALGLEPARPTQASRLRLLAEVHGKKRFAPFTDRVARMFHLTPVAAEVALERIVDPSVWRPSPFPGLRLASVKTGPGMPAGMSCFLAGDPGVRFPDHRHSGTELVLVMQGAFREAGGRIARAGDEVCMPATSEHDFTIVGEEPCVCAYTIEGGFEIL